MSRAKTTRASRSRLRIVSGYGQRPCRISLCRVDFLARYYQRSNVESTFSKAKAKFRDHVRGKTDTAMRNELLTNVLCHNLCCVIQSQCELGIEAAFWDGAIRAEVG
jgi:transposase